MSSLEADPSRLEGLLQYARLCTNRPEARDELLGHIQRMRARIQETLRDRQANYDGRRQALHADLCASIERNLSACRDIDQSLSDFMQGESTALDALERAIGEFLTSSDRLAELAHSSTPLCPGCGSAGAELICPACKSDRLIPDADFAHQDLEQAEVNEEFLAVFQAYQAVLDGRGGLADLSQALLSLEFSLLEAQALLEQALEESSEDADQQLLHQAVSRALEGVQRMHAVEHNRQTCELNQGWVLVFRGAQALKQLLPELR